MKEIINEYATALFSVALEKEEIKTFSESLHTLSEILSENGEYTERSKKILSQTPMERFGNTDELIGTLLWLLCYEASSFVNGTVIPVDGGFSAYSGV